MERKKLATKKIENPTSCQVTYTKRTESIMRKANELSVLCDTDVALILFSPSDTVTTFATNDRVEDIFLRFVGLPDVLRGGPLNNKEVLSKKLKQIKDEDQMLEKIAAIEELKEKLDTLKRQQHELEEKMRYYEPNVENINSVVEADAHQQFLSSAIQHIQLLKERVDGFGLFGEEFDMNTNVDSKKEMEETLGIMSDKESGSAGTDPAADEEMIERQ